MGYTGVLVISIIIIFIVILVSVLTTSKAYTYKHTVDPIENNPNLDNSKEQEQDSGRNTDNHS